MNRHGTMTYDQETMALVEADLASMALEVARSDIRELETLLREAAVVLGPEYDIARAQDMRAKILEALGEDEK